MLSQAVAAALAAALYKLEIMARRRARYLSCKRVMLLVLDLKIVVLS